MSDMHCDPQFQDTTVATTAVPVATDMAVTLFFIELY